MKSGLITRKDLAYWILILLTLLLGSLTINVENNETLINRVNFASAVVSIILATLAIVYSFFQTITSQTTEQRLAEASRNILGSTETLENMLDAVKESQQGIDKLHRSLGETESKIGERITSELNAVRHVLERKPGKERAEASQDVEITPKIFAQIVEAYPRFLRFVHYLWKARSFDIRKGRVFMSKKEEDKVPAVYMTFGLYVGLLAILRYLGMVKFQKDSLFLIEEFHPIFEEYCESQEDFSREIELDELFEYE